MLNNLINIDDVYRLREKIRQGYGGRLARIVLPTTRRRRVEDAWQHTDSRPRSWAGLPRIKRMWDERVTGSPDTPLRKYVAATFLQADGLHALSIGCGSGANEIRWMQTGHFDRMTALDLSPARIEAAKARALEEEYTGRLSFHVQDARHLDVESESIDVVIAESALHHMSPLKHMIAEIHRVLKPGGYVILRDYVGPSRFQWTKTQLDLSNALLQILPPELRRRRGSGTIKQRFHAQSRLSMLLSDPSEAAESSRIMELIQERFEMLSYTPLGGTLLHLILDDIAGNFMTDDHEPTFWLETLIEIEYQLIESGRINSDFVFAVVRK